jgi:hypothetical protein
MLMARTVWLGVGAAVMVASAAVAATSNHANADTRIREDRKVVEAAAGRFGYDAINDAWSRSTQADPAPLDTIRRAVSLRYVGGREQAGSIVVLTFASHRGTCLDLVSSPVGNTVRRHSGC